MVTRTGWTWEYVEEELDFPRYTALLKHWRRHPPADLLLAARYGFKPPPDPDAVIVNDPTEVAALLRMLQVIMPT